MFDRIMQLPILPLLLMIALSNTALAAILLVSLANDGTRYEPRTMEVGF